MVKTLFTLLLVIGIVFASIHLLTRDESGCGLEPAEACKLIKDIDQRTP